MTKMPLYLVSLAKNLDGVDVLNSDFWQMQEEMDIERVIQSRTRQGPIYPNIELFRTPHADLMHINLTRPPEEVPGHPGICLGAQSEKIGYDEFRNIILAQDSRFDLEYLKLRSGNEWNRNFKYFDLIFYMLSYRDYWSELFEEANKDFDVRKIDV